MVTLLVKLCLDTVEGVRPLGAVVQAVHCTKDPTTKLSLSRHSAYQARHLSRGMVVFLVCKKIASGHHAECQRGWVFPQEAWFSNTCEDKYSWS